MKPSLVFHLCLWPATLVHGRMQGEKSCEAEKKEVSLLYVHYVHENGVHLLGICCVATPGPR